MSQVKVQGDPSGTGTFTIAAPNSNADVTFTLPTSGGTILTTASGVTSFNTRTGAVTLASSDVTTALGFTPISGTSPAITTPTITGTREVRVALGAGTNLDMATGNYFTRTISGVTTFTVSNVPTTGTAVSLIFDLTNGGSATINWWSNVRWAGGTAPVLTSAGRDVLGFFTYDAGANWTGLLLGKDVK